MARGPHNSFIWPVLAYEFDMLVLEEVKEQAGKGKAVRDEQLQTPLSFPGREIKEGSGASKPGVRATR